MHVDIKDRLQDTTPEGVPALDHQRLQRRGRRRRYVKRAGTMMAVTAAVVAAVVAIPWPGSDVTIDGGYAGSGNRDPADQQAAADGWENLSVTEAIDRLITANREATPPPELTGDRQLVMHGLSASFHGQTDGSAYLTVAESEVRLNPDGSGNEHHATLVERIPVGTPAAQIRQAAIEARSADLEPVDSWDEAPFPAGDLDDIADRIDADSYPPPGQDDRPSQPAAFLDLHDILPILHQPTDRIRALELIRSMDAKWLEYRPHAQDLLARTGVGIVGIDPVDDGRHTIVFDPATGDVLGTIDETTWNHERAITGMSAITQRQIVEP